MAEPRALFVYGTLLPGESNHGHLEGASSLGPARTGPGFALVDLGPFPGLLEGGEGWVTGELFAVPEALWPALDRLEGHPHFFVRTPLVLEGGFAAEAYFIRRERAALRKVIAGGDWRAHRAGRGR
jgi:gamma-glutamylcyclotransferase (GGCT)/AIG2-like uncharacterized protein YtfP